MGILKEISWDFSDFSLETMVIHGDFNGMGSLMGLMLI